MESSLLHYLTLFVVYTLLAIGVIYGLFWWMRKNPGNWLQTGQRSIQSQRKMTVEQVMPLEPRKNLYVVRVDNERFLLATSMEGTQFLSKLEEGVDQVEAANPAETAPPAESSADESGQPASVSGRLMQSVRWLISSRTKFGTL